MSDERFPADDSPRRRPNSETHSRGEEIIFVEGIVDRTVRPTRIKHLLDKTGLPAPEATTATTETPPSA